MFTDFGKRTMAAMAGLMLAGGIAWAQPYVAYSIDGESTLTFTYLGNDKGDNAKAEEFSYIFRDYGGVSAITTSEEIKKVVFDESFKTNADAYTIESMKYFFSGCKILETVEGLGNLNTSALNNTKEMFSNCAKLTSVDFTGFNTSKVTDMSRMFESCKSLKRLDLSAFDTQNVTSMLRMFNECSKLKYIFVSDKFVVGSGTATDHMFDECKKISGAVTYNDEKTDGSMANYTTGYFTKEGTVVPDEGPVQYVSYSISDGVVTFKYLGTNDKSDEGTVVELEDVLGGEHLFTLDRDGMESATKVVFDESFKTTGYSITSMENLFSHMDNLETVEGLSNLNTADLTNISNMFSGCMKLKSVDFTGFDTQKVTNMSNLFYYCLALEDVNLKGFNTSSVTNMSGMFSNCDALTSLNLKSFNTANVMNTEYMFDDCDALTGLDITGFDLSNDTTMDCMFRHCKSLTVLDLSNFNTPNVAYMNAMFYGCQKLDTIYASEYFKIKDGAETEIMFTDSPSLKGGTDGSVTYNKNQTDGSMANYTTGYFTYRASTMEFNDGKQYLSYTLDSDGVLTFKYLGSSKKGDGTVVCIDDVFGSSTKNWIYKNISDYQNIKKVVFDESFKQDGYSIVSMLGFFYNLQNAESIEGLGNLNTSELTNTSKMFSNCWALTSVDLTGFDTSNVTDMSSMFFECSSLKSLVLSGFNTSKVTTMANMFGYCEGLTEFELKNFDTRNVTDMTQMFYRCTNIKALDVTSFNTSNVTSMKSMFNSCYNMQEVDLSSFDTRNVSNMKEMFSTCQRLVTIYVSDDFKVNSDAETDEMFLRCYELVGSNGTESYKSGQTDGSMANYTSGYFTKKDASEPSDPTAVKTLGAESLSGNVEYYDLMGRKMAAPSKGSMVIVRKNGRSQLAINK